jgi:hypothetical protein
MIGLASPPAAWLGAALAGAEAAADGAAVAAADGAVVAAGAELVAAPPQAVARREIMTNARIGVRPLTHRVRSMLVLLICTGTRPGKPRQA